MGRNYQKIQRGYSRSREKEWAQAIVELDYYDEELETISIGGGDPGVPALMAAALAREPAPPPAAAPPPPAPSEASTAPPPLTSPYEALAALATERNAGGTARKLWRRLTRLMGTAG